MQLLPETRACLFRGFVVSEEATVSRRAMSVGNTEKWILVEWGNGARGIVHSRYLVNVDHRELLPDCSVIVRKRGEQQIATFLARSNDRSILEKILKEYGTEESGAGPSAPAEPEEPGDFSGSASSWAPSVNDAPDSSDQELEEEKEDKAKVQKPDVTAKEERANRERSTKRVLTPSNRVNAIIPNSMKKQNANKKTRKRKLEPVEKENGENPVPPTEELAEEPKKEQAVQPNIVNINVNVDDVIAMNKMFKALFKAMKRMKRFYRNESVKCEEPPTKAENPPNTPAEPENEIEKCPSEDLNRSDDNVLISNKYGNIENNTEPIGVHLASPEKEDVYDIQTEAKKDEWVPIGSGVTRIHKDKFRKIKWTSYTMATRGLLLAVFPRRTLATHSLTGKRSPAFQNKPAKMCLDPKKVTDIIIEVMDRFRVRENLIRSIITTKCADECKMFKMRMEKKKGQSKNNQEIPENAPNNEQNVEEVNQ